MVLRISSRNCGVSSCWWAVIAWIAAASTRCSSLPDIARSQPLSLGISRQSTYLRAIGSLLLGSERPYARYRGGTRPGRRRSSGMPAPRTATRDLGLAARGLHVPRDDFHGACQLGRRAELDHLGARVENRCVARRDVVGVAGLERLVAGGELEGHLALDHVAPVLGLAAVVRQTLEEGGEVHILGVGLERDRVSPVEVVDVPLVSLHLDGLAGGRLRRLRHGCPPWSKRSSHGARSVASHQRSTLPRDDLHRFESMYGNSGSVAE